MNPESCHKPVITKLLPGCDFLMGVSGAGATVERERCTAHIRGLPAPLIKQIPDNISEVWDAWVGNPNHPGIAQTLLGGAQALTYSA